MSSVVALPDTVSEHSKRCVETLRELLAEAERGDILALAVAYIGPSHVVGSVLKFDGYYNSLLGAVTSLQHDLLHNGDVPNEG